MHKLTILPTVALGALSLAAIGSTSPAHAASGHSIGRTVVAQDRAVFAEDDDDADVDDDDFEESTAVESSGGGAAASSSGGSQLPATGGDISSIGLLAGFGLAAGGVMYRVTRQRAKATTLPR